MAATRTASVSPGRDEGELAVRCRRPLKDLPDSSSLTDLVSPVGSLSWSKLAVIQFVGALTVFYSASKEQKVPDNLDFSSAPICFISLIIGELGRKRSRVNFLKFYMFASSIGVLLSLASVIKSNLLVEVIQDLSGWESKKFELLKIGGVLAGLLVQLLSVITTVSLIGNMSPPKRAS